MPDEPVPGSDGLATTPHILMIQADQMAARCLPFYGHDVVRAPHMQGLAETGTVFDSAYCNFPLCAPSRFSMMAGQLASRIGAFDNASEFASDIPTFAHVLRHAGYRTCLAGKMHFVGPDQLHGFEERLTTDIYPADFLWTPDWRNGVRERFMDLTPVRQSGTCQRSIQLDYDEEVAHEAKRFIFDHARSADDRPMALVVSFTHPHDPYVALPYYWNQYEDAAIDMPDVPFIPIDDRDPHARDLSHHHGMDLYTPTEADITRTRRAYYANITMIDDYIGLMLYTLEQAGMADDTVVVVTADHGEMLGERGLWYKKNFYEPAARVPLIIRLPGQKPSRVGANVSLVDLLPTFAAIAETELATLPDVLDGSSLLPLIEDTSDDWPDSVIGELLSEGTAGPIVMLRWGRWKYIASSAYPTMLFDLKTDPNELTNRAGESALAAVEQAFADEVARRWDFEHLTAAVMASQQRRLAVGAAMAEGKALSWDYQPMRDASLAYYRGGDSLRGLSIGDVDERETTDLG